MSALKNGFRPGSELDATMYTSASTWDRGRFNGSARMTVLPDGFAESDWRAIVDFVSDGISLPHLLRSHVNSSLKRGSVQNAHPGTLFGRPPTTLMLANPWDAKARVLSRASLPFFSSFAHTSRLSDLISSPKSRIWMTKWNRTERSTPARVIHVRVSRLTPEKLVRNDDFRRCR